jgi:hypothetical protein
VSYLLMSCHQNAGQNDDIKIANAFFESVTKFSFLGMRIRSAFTRKLKSRLILGAIATIQFRIFCLPICCTKPYRLQYTEL